MPATSGPHTDNVTERDRRRRGGQVLMVRRAVWRCVVTERPRPYPSSPLSSYAAQRGAPTASTWWPPPPCSSPLFFAGHHHVQLCGVDTVQVIRIRQSRTLDPAPLPTQAAAQLLTITVGPKVGPLGKCTSSSSGVHARSQEFRGKVKKKHNKKKTFSKIHDEVRTFLSRQWR